MDISITCGNIQKKFKNYSEVVIGSGSVDCVIPELAANEVFKFVFAEKYNSYVLVNSCKNKNLLYNGKMFFKILVKQDFELSAPSISDVIKVTITDTGEIPDTGSIPPAEEHTRTSPLQNTQDTGLGTMNVLKKEQNMQQLNSNNIFDCDTEKNRISIIKEIGFKINEFKNSVKTANMLNFVLSAVSGILSVISAFGITNFLLGLKIDSSSSAINLTTNFWFLAGLTLIIVAVCAALKYSVSAVVYFNSAARKYGTSDIAQKCIIAISIMFLFVIYVLNLCYYKSVSAFSALFISLLFVGGLAVVTIGSGYFHGQIKVLKQHLDAYEYREDFETVLKSYRSLIGTYINKLSPNKINSVKGSLVNNQMKMVLEFIIGVLTAPFLAYGVSNTLAGCFPEAANWVRISGLRFSPIFLVLATFLIIFAFLSFVRAFTIGKQIKGSEIIKFDGFHDYNSHGITILGLDAMRSLEKEKTFVMFVACFIILIEFTMNVSYFITEIGGDIQGMFLSFVTALVPTALLIAETHMLSATMYKIHNLSDLLEHLD